MALRGFNLIILLVLASATGLPAQVSDAKLKSKLTNEARRWVKARHRVFSKCSTCNGVGRVARQVLTKRGIRTKYLGCKTCGKRGVRISKAAVKDIARPFLPDAKVYPIIGGSPLDFNAAQKMLRRNKIDELKVRLGFLRKYTTVEKVEVEKHASGLVFGTAELSEGVPITQWVWRDERWYLIGPDDVRHLIKIALRAVRVTVAEGVNKKKQARIIQGARDLGRKAGEWKSAFKRRRILVRPKTVDGMATAEVVFEVDYGLMVKTPRSHARDRIKLVAAIARAMHGLKWPKAIKSLTVQTTHTCLSPNGSPSNRPCEAVVVERQIAQKVDLDEMTDRQVAENFAVRSQLDSGWKIWTDERP